VRSGVVVPLGTDGECTNTFMPRCQLDGVQIQVRSTSDALIVQQTGLLP